MLKDENIKVEKDCTHLVPPDSVIDEEYTKILSEVMSISVDTPAETLRTLELNVVQRQIDLTPHAGQAFLTDDKEFMNFLKGQYVALEALRKFIADKHLRLLVEQDAKEEKESYAAYYKERLEILLPHDHHLFDDLVKGLVKEGWTEEGGSTIFRLLNKQGAAIKLFRHAESPQVIKICFSAEPEGEDAPNPKLFEFTEDAVKKYLDDCITFWRGKVPDLEKAKYYIDAFQSVRISLFGETKPSDIIPEPEMDRAKDV